ncbi:MAG: glucose-6-phosphate isomerase [Vicinamibacterales bacterium]
MHADLQFLTPPDIRHACETALARLAATSAVPRIWARDASLWPDTPGTRDAIADRLGWLDAPAMSAGHLDRIAEARAAAAAGGIDHIVLLGMGGSSLAPDVIARVLAPAQGPDVLRMLDSVAPPAIRRAFAGIERALVIVASKSGGTIEPAMLALEARRAVEAAGVTPWAHHFVAITDPGTPLSTSAAGDGFREVWLNPPDIGGRFSALSLFGLVPPALAGLPIADLLGSGRAMADACRAEAPAANPGAALGAFMAACAAHGRHALSLLLSPRLERFGLWVEQLVAESTGKHGLGVLPVLETEQRATRPGRAAVVLELMQEPADPELIDALAAAGTPVARITLGAPSALGGEFFRWEFATTICGLLMGVNPFDQPDVQSTKSATEDLLRRYTADRALPGVPRQRAEGGQHLGCSDAVDATRPVRDLLIAPDATYVAVLAYADPGDAATAVVLQDLVRRLGTHTSAPVTLGYGPRYLHSTGQLHKGGPAGGRFLLVAMQPADDLPIPGQPFSFGTLQLAQARGDLAALSSAGRQAVLLETGGTTADLAQALAALGL